VGTLLVLDAGNTLSGQHVSRLALGENQVEAMNAMGYDAMGIGFMDTQVGLDALRQRVEQASFAIVSANLVAGDTLEPLFEPYTILERDGLTFGIIGISDPNAAQGPGIGGYAIVSDPTEAARKYVDALRPQVDTIIVLSLLGLNADQELAAAVPGINIIVGGNSGQIMMEPYRVGNTLIVQQGYNGEWMGMLQATFDQRGVPSDTIVSMIILVPEDAAAPEMAAIKAKWDALYPTPTPEF